MKKIFILMISIIIICMCSNCYADNVKIYFNREETRNISTINNDGKQFIAINDLIEAIGGKIEINIDKEEVFIYHENVIYRIGHINADDEFDNSDNCFERVYMKVYSNPEYKLVKTGIINLGNGRNSYIYIFENKAYMDLSSENVKLLMNLFDCTFEYENNEVKIEKINIGKLFVEKNLRIGIDSNELWNVIPYELADEIKIDSKIIISEESGNTSGEPLEHKYIYYLKNNSKIKLTVIENEATGEKVLYKVTILTSDDREMGELLQEG